MCAQGGTKETTWELENVMLRAMKEESYGNKLVLTLQMEGSKSVNSNVGALKQS